jgi:protein TonB
MKDDHNAEVCGEVSMFEYIKQNDPMNFMARLTSLLASIVAHAAIITVMVVVPLIFCNAMQPQELLTFLIAPPSLPEALTPPVPQTGGGEKPRTIIVKGGFDLEPKGIPKGYSFDEPQAPLDANIDGSGLGVGPMTGIPTQGLAGGFDITQHISKVPIVLPPPPIPHPPAPMPVISAHQAAKLIHKINPIYPEIARLAHVIGTVILQAVIDEEGNVSQLKVLSGHPLLAPAAEEAVRQWKYSPTILNGEPVPVIATVTVTFKFQ